MLIYICVYVYEYMHIESGNVKYNLFENVFHRLIENVFTSIIIVTVCVCVSAKKWHDMEWCAAFWMKIKENTTTTATHIFVKLLMQ